MNTEKEIQRFKQLEKDIEKMMITMGLNLKDDSLKRTPYRIAKMFLTETCKGLYEPAPIVTTFENKEKYNQMVLVKNMAVKSLCEHHFQPFIGKCHIAYIPGKRIIGLSKFSRIVEWFSRRPQVQEKLTNQIYDYLVKQLKTKNVAVYIEAEHLCMKIRGVNEHNSSTITSKLGGAFLKNIHTREEFFNSI